MRTIGLLFFLLLLASSAGRHDNNPKQAGRSFTFRLPFSTVTPLTKTTNDVDTNQLKQSDWYNNAISHISESEYEIKYDSASKRYGAPNRNNQLRSFFTAKTFIILPRDDQGDSWQLELTTLGVYADKNILYAPVTNPIVNETGKTIAFSQNNFFTTEYINSREGIRQNFIIQQEPVSKPKTLQVKLRANDGWIINKVQDKEIHFAKNNNTAVEKKITYNGLKVWDATNRELSAYFSVNKNDIAINVQTAGAVYPITIDPLSTGTNGTADWIGDDANEPSSFFGYSVSSAGDVNGDGFSDVIIGAYGYDEAFTVNEGQAFAYHGSATGLSLTPNSQLDDGNQNGALFGRSVACAGDVNGDGYSDVIVGADMHNDPPNNREGRAYIYYGSATGLGFTYGTTLRDADQADANFGWSVAGVGDVNGDGFSDMAVGAYNFDDGFTNEGKVFVYYGIAGMPSTITAAVTLADADQVDAQFGVCVAGAGDVNGDGYSDIVVGSHLYNDGANTDEGRAFIYYGSGGGLTTTPLILSDANQANAQFGFSVACGGDINGDGYSDVIISANLYDDDFTDEGVVFIYYGSSSGLSATHNAIADDGNQGAANFGGKCASAGDVNGDGYSDVIIGAYTYDDNLANEGVAFIYYGSSTGLSASPDCMLDDANGTGTAFGYSVASAGDVNGDGYSDVIIGAYTYIYLGNIDYGLTYVYHGSANGISSSPANTPADANQADANFGVSVASAGDVNGDGYSDVIIGAWLYDDGPFTNEGRAFVYHGSATGLSATPNSILDDADQSNAFFGETVAGAGDVNGDGYSDVIIGADSFDDGANTDEGRCFVYHGSAAGLGASPNSVLDDADQPFANFGVSMAGAGDVNGDGYGDVIVGAIGFDDGANTNEGRAFIYYGSVAGLANNPGDTPDDANQAGCYFGWSVSGAGDINGDGFSDVIIGAIYYDDGPNTDEGRAFVYYGNGNGLSATPDSTPDDADQSTAWFGECVAAAGDVNADGFGDVIIGAKLYDDGVNTDEGRAFVYYGSVSGLSASPNSTPDDANQSNSSFGISVACAGDINGDGYSDIIIGARTYDDGANTDEGRGFIYYGSSLGLSASPASTPGDADEAFANFGYSVASAGDINGDGFSDVIIGSHQSDDGGNFNEGKAFVYYGNSTKGLRNNLRLYNADLITPIQQANMSEPNLFGAGLYAKSFIGKQKGKMVWETVKNGNPFSGSPITNSVAYTAQAPAFSDLGVNGIELKQQIAKQVPTKGTYVRARVKYDLTTAITGQVYGPWRYPEGFMRGRRDMGSVPLPVQFISFTVTKQNETSVLKWSTTGESVGVQYEIQHATDGIHFQPIKTIPAQNQNNNRNDYEWVHTNPIQGKNYYRIRATGDNKETFTAIKQVTFLQAALWQFYPNPVKPGGTITLQSGSNLTDCRAEITDLIGKKIMSLSLSTSNQTVMINLPFIAPGYYILAVKNKGKTVFSGGFIVTQ